MSRGLIAGPELKVQGMPWQETPVQFISPDALTSKVLCRRHNEALSPLDGEALHIFEALRAARRHVTRPSLSRRSWATIVSGEALELWAMKTIAGFCASGMDFRFGDHRLHDFDLPLAEIAEALSSPNPRSVVSLEIPGGMEDHEPRIGRSAVTILWEVDTDASELKAMLVRMQGIAFKFHFTPSGTARDGSGLVRPHILDLIGPTRKGRLYFSWRQPTAGRYAFIRVRANMRKAGRTPASSTDD